MPATATLNPFQTRLIRERQELVQRIEGLQSNCAEHRDEHGQPAPRDMNDDELAVVQGQRERIAAIDRQLAVATQNLQLDIQTSERIAAINGQAALPPGGAQYRTAGDLLWDCLHQNDRAAADRYASVQRRLQTRAAEHMGTTAEETVPVAGGFGGLITTPVVGPIIDLAWGGMPFMASLSPQAAPNPMQWSRPRIVDPYLDTAAGPQAGGLQKGELPSKHFDIKSETLEMSTVGNYLNISIQLLNFVAGSLDTIVTQLNKRLSRSMENAALAEAGKTTAKVTLAADAAADDVIQAIADAAALVFIATSEPATKIAFGPNGLSRLVGLTDLALRPILPSVGAVNAPGTANASGITSSTVLGLTPVLTPGISDTTMYVYNGASLEAATYRFPLLDAVEPSVLGRQLAVAASFAFYSPVTAEAGAGDVPPAKREAIVKIAP